MLQPPSNLPKFEELSPQARLEMVRRLWANEDYQIVMQAQIDAETEQALTAVKNVADAELPLARWKWKTWEKLGKRLPDLETTLLQNQ